MANLTATYLGLELDNPIVVGACGLTSDLSQIQKLEKAGAGAVVLKSLFEEQIQLESLKLDAELHKNENLYAEMTSLYPELTHAGPQEHVMWVKKAKQSVSIPVIASLNAVSRDIWTTYAAELAGAGVDALELNFYASPRSFDATAESIEAEQISIVADVKKAVALPVSVKLSPFYTNPLRVIRAMDNAGADGFVLFNRLFQPDIDVVAEKNIFPLGFSSQSEAGLALRYAGLLYDNVSGGICSSTGIAEAGDVLKMILAGADCVQTVTALYRNGAAYIKTMLDYIVSWLDERGYASLDAIRGSMSRKRSKDPWVYTRSQYVKLLMRGGESILKEIG